MVTVNMSTGRKAACRAQRIVRGTLKSNRYAGARLQLVVGVGLADRQLLVVHCRFTTQDIRGCYTER
jgi:hypothetical protein